MYMYGYNREKLQVTSLSLLGVKRLRDSKLSILFILILHQHLTTNLQENEWQLEGRINNQTLRVKGLMASPQQ